MLLDNRANYALLSFLFFFFQPIASEFCVNCCRKPDLHLGKLVMFTMLLKFRSLYIRRLGLSKHDLAKSSTCVGISQNRNIFKCSHKSIRAFPSLGTYTLQTHDQYSTATFVLRCLRAKNRNHGNESILKPLGSILF